MHVCVMGAGIVGLATAYELQRQGLQVTVIDQAAPGMGTSGGNGAQLSYSYVQPLADPGIWAQLPKLLLAGDSPLKIRPRLDPHQWRWGLQFLAACNRSTSERSTAALLALAARSRAGLERMLGAERLDCDFSRTGKLVLYASQAALDDARRQVELQRAWGCEQELVTPARCAEIEPALAHYAAQIAGAVHTPSECAADCLKVCQGLHALLAARGVRFVLGARITGLTQSGGRVLAAQTRAGAVEADAYVLALGSTSHLLARTLGLSLPVYPLKGYSITFDAPAEPAAAPRVSVTDAARKVVFARLGSRVRVAGMAELVGFGMDIPPERIASLRAATRAVFPHSGPLTDPQPWAGQRPATPTGLPLVGRHAHGPANLLLNTGHGALGFTLAFGSAAAIAETLAA
ncbi:MAG: D-amino acid dehydrogenase [Proteobacteria bacterium]|nr:D-amino acid dehydrogenase [Pseudomonadota bacterium]